MHVIRVLEPESVYYSCLGDKEWMLFGFGGQRVRVI